MSGAGAGRVKVFFTTDESSRDFTADNQQLLQKQFLISISLISSHIIKKYHSYVKQQSQTNWDGNGCYP